MAMERAARVEWRGGWAWVRRSAWVVVRSACAGAAVRARDERRVCVVRCGGRCGASCGAAAGGVRGEARCEARNGQGAKVWRTSSPTVGGFRPWRRGAKVWSEGKKGRRRAPKGSWATAREGAHGKRRRARRRKRPPPSSRRRAGRRPESAKGFWQRGLSGQG